MQSAMKAIVRAFESPPRDENLYTTRLLRRAIITKKNPIVMNRADQMRAAIGPNPVTSSRQSLISFRRHSHRGIYSRLRRLVKQRAASGQTDRRSAIATGVLDAHVAG